MCACGPTDRAGTPPQVMGTSLVVHPFANLVGLVRDDCPRRAPHPHPPKAGGPRPGRAPRITREAE